MMKMIFFNITWMKHYQGITAEDSPKGGGKYISENEHGHEIFNFLPLNNYMYGYVQPTCKGKVDYLSEEIKIDRLGASKQASVDNVLSVWVANPKKGGGTWVVGWYKNSTVYRGHQQAPTNSNRIFELNVPFGYYAMAKAENCVCLPIEERTIQVPRRVKGGIGTSNVWFADSQEEITLNCRKDVEKLVLQYQNPEITQLNSIRQEIEQGDFFNANT